MSLQLRLLLPILLLSLVGVGASLVMLIWADGVYQDTHSFQSAATAQSKAVADIVEQSDIADAELERVLGMSTLSDTDASWLSFEAASAIIDASTSLIAGLPHTADMNTLNEDLIATMAQFHHHAAVLYGKQTGEDIPTRELIWRLKEKLITISDDMAAQLAMDSNAFTESTNLKFNRELQRLNMVVLALTGLVILGSVLSVRNTSAQIRKVSRDLGQLAGTGAKLVRRNEIANLRDVASSFAQRARALGSFQSQISGAVDAAVAGNFSHRLEIKEPEADLQLVASQMNQLLRGVEAALAEASDILMRIAKGDLQARITGDYQGVLLDLKRDTNATGEQLYLMVTNIDTATRAINGSMKQILTGSNALSDRTRNQVGILDSLAHSMDTLTRTARDVTENVAIAREVSDDTAARAIAGDRVAEEATEAILAIQSSSEKINAVTEVVEGLAFQTSILAINAAVEAARAGDAGRGFAIVAQEVRNLANRSSEAARMIAEHTSATLKQIHIGAEKVQATRDVLGRIKLGIEGLHDRMQAVDGVSRSQLQRFLDLAGTIAELDQETQMNATLAQDSVLAASDVHGQATQLQQQVAVFRLAERSQQRFAAE